MATYRNPLIHGSGMLDTVLNTFTYSKYPGEHHFPYYSYLGPGSRLDIRLDENNIPNVIEINPLPGILPNPVDNSCFPKAARMVGMDYNAMINAVLNEAIKRYKK